MPTIDQCDGSPGNLAALSSTLEIFDKFKSISENGKDSDSEESFHLPLDDDDVESQSLPSNGRDKESHSDEVEEEMLNKFGDISDQSTEKNDDTLIVDTEKNADEQTPKKIRRKSGTDDDDDASNIEVKLTFDFAEYESSSNGEFRSFYEADDTVLHINKLDKSTEPEIDDDSDDVMVIDQTLESEETTLENKTEDDKDNDTNDSEVKLNDKEPESNIEETSTEDLLKQLDESINSSTKTEEFKIPEKKPEPAENKKNDQGEEDDVDLLDISMIRETEEDDACAIAEAIEEDADADDADKEAPTGEKSDEEPNDKVEPEQESSDGDKENDQEDNSDNYQLGFDDMDEDSHADITENDASSVMELENQDSSNAEDSESKSSEVQSCEKQQDVEDDAMEQDKETSEEEERSGSASGVDESSSKESTSEKNLEIDDNAVRFNETDSVSETTEESNNGTSSKPPPVIPLPDVPRQDTASPDITKIHVGKRSLSFSDIRIEVNAKKAKLIVDAPNADTQNETPHSPDVPSSETEPKEQVPSPNDNIKTLTAFAKFMQFRKLSSKLSRSDLEQFCIQKICECLMLKSTEGELHQTIKKQQKVIEGMRKDLQQLIKQSKDLEIVNKKLMNELRVHIVQKKPLVPLKITRSVGLQVRLNPGSNESSNQMRRRQPMSTTPQKPVVSSPGLNRSKTPSQQPAAVRQVLQTSPQKPMHPPSQVPSSSSTQLLSQALQQNANRKPSTPINRRSTTTPRKPPETPPASNPGVIDLTDEDEKLAANRSVNNAVKVVNKTGAAANNKTVALNKVVPGKSVLNQGKPVGLQQQKTNKNNLPQGIRLAPGSVISSSANGSQMLYVVPTIASSSGGTQKVAFVNFQPTNGVLSGTLNGSTMSVMSNKGQTLTLKTVASPIRKKHPAPLPPLPRITLDPSLKPILPKPHLTIKKIDIGIILQWKMPYNLDMYENIASYQLYAYQETSAPPSTDMWRKVGDVKALALPMACTLTQFADKNKYYFAVRSVDVHNRIGAFSDPEEISL